MSGGWFHCSVKPISRAAGRSVVAAAAYRLGADLYDQMYDRAQSYSRRGGVEQTFTLAPASAPAWVHDPERLWNAAEKAETRKNSLVGRECELALPSSLDAAAREAITREFARALVDRYGVAISVGIHGPSRQGDDRNHHAHVLMTTRTMESDGLGAKTRILDDRKTGPQEVIWMRQKAADLINAALEHAGQAERVTHLSFEARGIDRTPTEHLGPSASEMERREPGSSDRADRNREAAARNEAMADLVAELAAVDAEIAAAEQQRLDDRYGTSEPTIEAPMRPLTPREVMDASFAMATSTALQGGAEKRLAALFDLHLQDDEPEPSPRTPLAPAMPEPATAREAMNASFAAVTRLAIDRVQQTGETWLGARLWQKTVDLYQRGAEALADFAREALSSWRRLIEDERDPDNADLDYEPEPERGGPER